VYDVECVVLAFDIVNKTLESDFNDKFLVVLGEDLMETIRI